MTARLQVLVVGSELLSTSLLQGLDSRGMSCTVLTKSGLPLPDSPPSANFLTFDFEKSKENDNFLHRQVNSAALVICLTSGDTQSDVLRVCIMQKRHMLTPFVLSAKARHMEHEALDAGITILSEAGAVPGLDHITSIALIERLHESGQNILRFETYLGDLPVSSSASNPFKHKFSRPAVEALTSVVRAARYIESDQVRTIKSPDVIKTYRPYQRLTPSNLPMETYFNGDSTALILQYGLQGVQTYARYVVRYEGFCRLMKAFGEIGLLDMGKKPVGETWLEVLTDILREKEGLSAGLPDWVPASAAEIVLKALNVLSDGTLDQRMSVIQALNYVGALATTPVGDHPSILHAFSALLDHALPFRPNEHDFLLLDHTIAYESGGVSSELRASVEVDGVPSQCSALNRVAGLHLAAAALWLSRGGCPPGLMLPLQPEYVQFVVAELQRDGIVMNEKSAGIQPSIA